LPSAERLRHSALHRRGAEAPLYLRGNGNRSCKCKSKSNVRCKSKSNGNRKSKSNGNRKSKSNGNRKSKNNGNRKGKSKSNGEMQVLRLRCASLRMTLVLGVRVCAISGLLGAPATIKDDDSAGCIAPGRADPD
jgi:hypothetical protein